MKRAQNCITQKTCMDIVKILKVSRPEKEIDYEDVRAVFKALVDYLPKRLSDIKNGIARDKFDKIMIDNLFSIRTTTPIRLRISIKLKNKIREALGIPLQKMRDGMKYKKD